MRKPDLGFMPREVAPGVYKFQAVRRTASRNGIDQVKTLFPHARLAPEASVASVGFDTALMIERAQRLRATEPGGEAARRRWAIVQRTLSEIDARDQARLQRDLAELDEEINAASRSIAFSGDPDTLFHTNYPNVVDQYRDFDQDPDRQERMFLRTDEYRQEKRNSQVVRKQEKPRERRRRAQREMWEAFGLSGPLLEDDPGTRPAKLDAPINFTEERMRKEGLTAIRIPVPPMLETVSGYDGDAPFVGFYWSGGADKPEYNDGAFSGTGDSWGFGEYIRHPAVWPILLASRLNLGAYDSPPEHALVLDRNARRMYIAPYKRAQAFLKQYRPPLEKVDIHEFIARVQAGLAEAARQPVDHAAIMDAMKAHSKLIQEMKTWLDVRIDTMQN